MHATHLHSGRALAVVAAAAALALALALMLSASLADVKLGVGGERGSAAETSVSALAMARTEPRWIENPFAWPLLQVPDHLRQAADRERASGALAGSER